MTVKQTHKASLVEALLNVFIGFAVSVVTQITILRYYGFAVTVSQSLSMGVIFTFISIARSFLVRRWFEHLRVRGILP